MIVRKMDFAGVTEAIVAFGEADPEVGEDGPDQEHLEHHQDQRQWTSSGPNSQERDSKHKP